MKFFNVLFVTLVSAKSIKNQEKTFWGNSMEDGSGQIVFWPSLTQSTELFTDKQKSTSSAPGTTTSSFGFTVEILPVFFTGAEEIVPESSNTFLGNMWEKITCWFEPRHPPTVMEIDIDHFTFVATTSFTSTTSELTTKTEFGSTTKSTTDMWEPTTSTFGDASTSSGPTTDILATTVESVDGNLSYFNRIGLFWTSIFGGEK
jgi:hypothetical protein